MSKNIVLTSVNERGIAEVILNRPERNNPSCINNSTRSRKLKLYFK